MDQDITNTPQLNARRNERDARTLDSPQRRRIPAPPVFRPVPILDVPYPALPMPPALAGPSQHHDPFRNNFAPAPQVYGHLPAHLAQALAQLPPLPTHGHGRGRGQQQPLNFTQLAQAAAALPPLAPLTICGHYQNLYVPAPVPAPLPPVCNTYMIFNSYNNIFIIVSASSSSA